MEVTRRRGRRRKKLLDDLKDRRGYSHLKEEALDRTMWRNRFGGDFEPVIRQNTEWMNNVFVVLVPLTTVFWLVFISVISTSYGSFVPADKVELVTEWVGWRTVLLEKMVAAQLPKKFPAFYWTRGFITLYAKNTAICTFSIPDESTFCIPPFLPFSIKFILL